jgi:hypothetical protein
MKTNRPRCEAPANLTVQQHDAIRRELLSGLVTDHDFDDIDIEAAADPIHDHRPQSAPKHRANRVLGILDQLEKENVNRRFTR